jgi:hypothetical protein
MNESVYVAGACLPGNVKGTSSTRQPKMIVKGVLMSLIMLFSACNNKAPTVQSANETPIFDGDHLDLYKDQKVVVKANSLLFFEEVYVASGASVGPP